MTVNASYFPINSYVHNIDRKNPLRRQYRQPTWNSCHCPIQSFRNLSSTSPEYHLHGFIANFFSSLSTLPEACIKCLTFTFRDCTNAVCNTNSDISVNSIQSSFQFIRFNSGFKFRISVLMIAASSCASSSVVDFWITWSSERLLR